MKLTQQHCTPCQAGAAPLAGERLRELADQLPEEWQVVEGHHLQRRYRLADFRTALDLVNRIGAIAETENHHPDLRLGWGKVEVTLWTHKIGGLSENDFVLAAHIEAAAQDMRT